MYYYFLVVRELDYISKECIVFLAIELVNDDSPAHPVNTIPRYFLSFFHLSEFPIEAKIMATRKDIPRPSTK